MKKIMLEDVKDAEQNKFKTAFDNAAKAFREKEDYRTVQSLLRPLIIGSEAEKNKAQPNSLYWKAAALYIVSTGKNSKAGRVNRYQALMKSKQNIIAALQDFQPKNNKPQEISISGSLKGLGGHVRHVRPF